MAVPSHALLRRLGAGSRPGVVAAPAATAAGVSHDDFGHLLRRAERGELSSGRQVRPTQDVRLELTDEQVQRISRAADAAEAAGAARLLVAIDGMAVALDVPARRIDAALPPAGGGDERVEPREIFRGVDAAVRLADTRAEESAEDTDGAEAPGPGATRPAALIGRLENESLLHLLSGGPGDPATRATDGD